MARKTDRNFLADFAALDIEYLPEKGPEVSRDIQMVYVMGNVAPAAVGAAGLVPGYTEPSTINVSYGVSFLVGAVAAERTRLELLAVATGGGLWVYSISNLANLAMQVTVFTIGALTGLATQILPTAANSSAFGAGAAATAIIDFGTSLVAAPATALGVDISNAGTDDPAQLTGNGTGPIYIGPGRVLVVQLVATNIGAQMQIQWREVA